MQLALAVLFDLGLNKPLRENEGPEILQDTFRLAADNIKEVRRPSQERRAFLICFMITNSYVPALLVIFMFIYRLTNRQAIVLHQTHRWVGAYTLFRKHLPIALRSGRIRIRCHPRFCGQVPGPDCVDEPKQSKWRAWVCRHQSSCINAGKISEG